MHNRVSTRTLPGILAFASALGLATVSAPAHADPPDRDSDAESPSSNPESDLPPGVHREERPRRWPLIAGGVAFGVTYGASVLVAAADDERLPTAWLNVPVFGPWIFVSKWQGFRSTVPGSDDPLPGMATFFSDIYLVADGLIQAAGLVLLTYGGLSHESVLVVDAPTARARFRLTPVPTMLGRGAPGLGLVGTF
jgi:hypothetical protein